MHKLWLAADVCFVAFHNATILTKRRSIGIFDCFSNAVAQIPRGLVSDFQRALELISRHPFARLANQKDSRKPLSQRQVRVMEYTASGNGEVITA